MRIRVAGVVAAVVLCIVAGALWAADNFAAGPYDQLMQRAFMFVVLGASHGQDGWLSDGVNLMAQAAAAEPDSAEAHILAGMGYAVQGDVDRAVRHYQEARVLAPSLPIDALIGDAYSSVGNWSMAEVSYLHALELDPESVLAMKGLARVAEVTGRPDVAEEYLEQIVAVTAPDPQASIELARFYLRIQTPERALAALEGVADDRRTSVTYFAQLGFVYEALGRTEEACRELRTALRLGSNDQAVSAALERLQCGARS